MTEFAESIHSTRLSALLGEGGIIPPLHMRRRALDRAQIRAAVHRPSVVCSLNWVTRIKPTSSPSRREHDALTRRTLLDTAAPVIAERWPTLRGVGT
jgi:hypothetical protein